MPDPTQALTVLIAPPTSRRRLFGCFAPLASREPPLGLVYLASQLVAQGLPIQVIDGEPLRQRELLARLAPMRPGLVGLTATTFSFFDAATTIEAIRTLLPTVRIVLGGAHATALPEDSLRRIAALDACVIGEGEETLVDLARGQPFANVRGLAYRVADGIPARTASRMPAFDLDCYDPDWGVLPGFPTLYRPPWQSRASRRSASLVVSRGCPYACTFCAAAAVHGHRPRAHSPSRVLALLRRLEARWGITEFYFHDDHFTADLEWLRELCALLREQKSVWRWSCASRVECLDAPTLALMHRAGCRQIGVGAETGSDAMLDRLQKHSTVAATEAGLRRVRSAGMARKVYLMLGTPEETPQDLAATRGFLERVQPEHVQVLYFTPLPGSPSWAQHQPPPALWPHMNLLNPMPCARLSRLRLRAAEFSWYLSVYGPASVRARWFRRKPGQRHPQPP